MSEKSELYRDVAALAESGAWSAGTWDAGRGEHPSAELLAGYVDGEVPEMEAVPLLDHLAACPECAGLVADLMNLHDLPPAPGEPSDFEAAAAWRRLRTRIAAAPAGAAAREAPAPPSPWTPSPWTPSRWAPSRPAAGWAAAACLLIASLVLGSWGLHLDARLDRLLVPQPNVPVVDLDAGSTRGSGAGVEVRPADPYYLLVVYPLLDSAARERFGSYSWTLLGDDGEERLSGAGLELQHGDYFTLLLHRESLPEGAYRILIEGHAGDAAQSVGEQSFRIATGG